jgi:MFS family permease
MLLSGTEMMLLYLFPILFGLNYGAIINLKPLAIFESFGGRKVGKVYGWVTGCFLIGSSWGPFLTGYIFDRTHSYKAPFVVNLVLGCIATGAILVFARRARPWNPGSYAGG